MVVKIAVLGAGVNGLACAVQIKEKYKDAHVVIISRDFSPDTTGDGSAGLWYPYLIGSTPPELVAKWGCESYDFLHRRWLEGGYGICLQPIFNLYRDKSHWSEPSWSKEVFGFHKLGPEELQYFSHQFSAPFTAGHTFTTFTFQPPLFLDYLLRRFKRAGGHVTRGEVTSLQDAMLAGCDVVVNCTGLAARTVVPDKDVFPYRGQVVRVKAPWVTQTIIDEDIGNYIIPNAETVVLGGTKQLHDYNTKVDEKDTAFILNGCQSRIPSLQSGQIVKQWVGLRPGRRAVRVDAEQRDGKIYIHNYGHGGCGLTLFWGCASSVVQLLDQHLDKIKQTSKL